MDNQKIEIIEFTDPVCTWCWGSEPILRKLETRYGDQIKISFIMGGLVKDITSFDDSYNDMGGDPDRSNKSIAMHWQEASIHHRMPVKSQGFQLFTKSHPSTFPQNMAYKAAQMQDQEKAGKFLRRIREATATEARQTNLPEVLAELASEVGLNVTQFLDDLNNGKAQKAFEEDLRTTAANDVHGFPSFLLKYGDKKMLLRGYQRYESFKSAIQLLSENRITENQITANEESILNFLHKYGSVAPAEIQIAFDLSDEELAKIINTLFRQERIVMNHAENPYLIHPNEKPYGQDQTRGIFGV